MKSNAMAGAVSLVGVGLCGIAAAMLLQVTGTRADASPRAVDAFGPGEPTVVWYGNVATDQDGLYYIVRSWSDGRLEAMKWYGIDNSPASGTCFLIDGPCRGEWLVISDPQQGYAAFADVNADEMVDGVDLAAVLGQWGDAPRDQFPPSDCPLNLINP